MFKAAWIPVYQYANYMKINKLSNDNMKKTRITLVSSSNLKVKVPDIHIFLNFCWKAAASSRNSALISVAHRRNLTYTFVVFNSSIKHEETGMKLGWTFSEYAVAVCCVIVFYNSAVSVYLIRYEL